jgi:hypothetical protein
MSHLQIKLTKPQSEFVQLQSECLYPLFTGGYGSGKSFTLGASSFLDALHSPNAWIGIYEPTYKLIVEVAMPYIVSFLEQYGIPYRMNKDEKVIVTDSNQLGNFRFRSMDDPSTIIGYEDYTSHVDEIDTLPKDKAQLVVDKIMGRCRQWPKGLPTDFMQWSDVTEQYEPRNKICFYSTPEGFNYTYSVWGKNTPESENYNPEYMHLKCKTSDNPFASQAYINNLTAKYTEEKAKAYLEGEWVNMVSGSVYYAYDRVAHDSKEEIKDGEVLHIGVDFNVCNMAGIVFVERNGGKTTHAVDEMIGLYDTPDLIDEIKTRYPNNQIICYPDSTGSGRDTTNASNSDIKQLRAAGFRVKARPKNPLVKDRVSCVNNAFSKQVLFVNSKNCPELVECLTQQAYDKNNKPDKSQDHDHPNDAFGYRCYYKFNRNTQPAQIIEFDFARRA